MEVSHAFFLSDSVREASNDAIVLYLIMRADACVCETAVAKNAKKNSQLACGFSVDVLSTRSGLPVPTVQRLCDELVKRKWIRKEVAGGSNEKVFCLGVVEDFKLKWFCDDAKAPVAAPPKPEPTAAELIAAKLAKDKREKKSLAVETKKKLVAAAFEETMKESRKITSTQIRRLFEDLYKAKYGVECPLVEEGMKSNPRQVTYVYINRALKWSKDPQQVLDVIKFVFKNWEKIKLVTGLDGRPTFNLVGSSKVWPRFVSFFEEGIPERKTKHDTKAVVDRYEKDDSKSVGW